MSGSVITLKMVDTNTLAVAVPSSSPSMFTIITTLTMQGIAACISMTETTSLRRMPGNSRLKRMNNPRRINGTSSSLLNESRYAFLLRSIFLPSAKYITAAMKIIER